MLNQQLHFSPPEPRHASLILLPFWELKMELLSSGALAWFTPHEALQAMRPNPNITHLCYK